MRLKVSTALFDELLRRQTVRGYTDEVVRRLDAIWLHTDVGPSYYLTRDGQVLEDDVTLNEGIRVLEAPRVFTALVAGARTLQADELLELLPQRSVGSVDCRSCGGRRRVTIGTDTTTGGPIAVVCFECAGLGWTLSELTMTGSSVGLFASDSVRPSQEWDYLPLNGLTEPVQFFRANVSGPSTGVAVVCNRPPRATEHRARMAEALAARFPCAVVGFIENDGDGYASVSSFGAADPHLLAFVVAVFKASCGWDESEIFAVAVDDATFYVRVRADERTWRGTNHWNDAV